MKYYCDGWKNKYSVGFTIFDETNNIIKYVNLKNPNLTNNEVEVRAIIETLKICKEKDIISSDSTCCIGWIKKGYSKSRPDLTDLLLEGKELLKEKDVDIRWEGRDYNLAGVYNEKIYNENKYAMETNFK